ncbi:hypothetical protein HDU93_005059, partial [Gonapodya sp. JEL0774]
DEWKVQRKIASNIFNVKVSPVLLSKYQMLRDALTVHDFHDQNFRDFYSPIFHHDATRVAEHLAQAGKMNAFIDIHDLLLRSTLDSFLKIAMGEDKGCLAGKPTVINGKYTLPSVEFAI